MTRWIYPCIRIVLAHRVRTRGWVCHDTRPGHVSSPALNHKKNSLLPYIGAMAFWNVFVVMIRNGVLSVQVSVTLSDYVLTDLTLKANQSNRTNEANTNRTL
jgi:hypothetical protein